MVSGLAKLVRKARQIASKLRAVVFCGVGRYTLAATAVFAATVIRIMLHPVLGAQALYLPFILALIAAARWAGPGPGLFATVLSALSVGWFLLPSLHSFTITDPAAMFGLALFLIVGAVISLLIGSLRASLLSRHRAEEALRESEAQFRTLADGIPQLCWMANPDGWVFWYNRRSYEYTGATPVQIEGWGWQSVHDPESLPKVMERWRHSIATGEPFEMVLPLRGADGLYRQFLARAVSVRDPQGRLVRWFGTHTDISEERKQADEALRKSHDEALARAAELQAIMGAMPVAIFISRDPKCRTIIANRSAYELFRLPPGSDLSQLPPEGDVLARFQLMRDGQELPASELPLMKAAATGQPVSDYEFDVLFEGEEPRNLVGRAVPLIDASGKPRGAVCVVADVTEREQAAQRLLETQKLESIGRLAGGIAHDFNNLLTVIMASASSASLKYSECAELQDILAAAEQAAYLTKQLLAYAGKGQFVVQRFDLNGAISQSRDLLAASVSREIKLALTLAPEELLIEADRSRIEQILLNLVINASEAIADGAGGLIEIATGSCDVTPGMALRYAPSFAVQPGRFVFLEVKDNGQGMDEAVLARVFDPFFTTKFTGRGLGLAAVHGIVRSRKGFIEIHSSPGAGSIFRIFLPTAAEQPPTEIPSPVPSGSRRLERASASILVLDDEELVRKLACATLRDRGYEMLEAKDVTQALEMLARSAELPSLALIDLATAMGGVELVKTLNRNYPGMKIIVTSGYPEEDARNLFPAGAVAGFLQKPYTIMALAEKADDALSSRFDIGSLPNPHVHE